MIEKDYPYEIAQSIAADTEKNMANNIGRLKILPDMILAAAKM